MSGGHFDYNQHYIGEIADSIERLIETNGKQKESYANDNPFDSEYYYTFSPEVLEKFQEGLSILRQAAVYARRIDWLVSGDDSESTFFARLKEDLQQLK